MPPTGSQSASHDKFSLIVTRVGGKTEMPFRNVNAWVLYKTGTEVPISPLKTPQAGAGVREMAGLKGVLTGFVWMNFDF